MNAKPRPRRLKVQWRDRAWTPRIVGGPPPSSRGADRPTSAAISRSRLEIRVWEAPGVLPFLDLDRLRGSPSAIASTSTKAKL